MDDLNLLPSLVFGANTLLHHCIKALKWAGLDFQADESRSIVIKEGLWIQHLSLGLSQKTVLTFVLI